MNLYDSVCDDPNLLDEYCAMSEKIAVLGKENAELRAKLAIAKDALEFYANQMYGGVIALDAQKDLG